jgi:hypothetical protein
MSVGILHGNFPNTSKVRKAGTGLRSTEEEHVKRDADQYEL